MVPVPKPAAARASSTAPATSCGLSSIPGRRWQCRSITSGPASGARGPGHTPLHERAIAACSALVQGKERSAIVLIELREDGIAQAGVEIADALRDFERRT